MKGIAATLLLLLATQVHASAPETLRGRNPNRTAPIWVSASKAADRDGNLSPELFGRYGIADLKRAAAVQRQGHCSGERPAEIFARSETVAELATNARAVIQGEITQRSVGFFEDSPGALLTVRVERVLGDFAHDEVFLYFPEAEFQVGPDRYCKRPATHPARPRVGDRVVIFAYRAAADTTGRLLYTQSSKHLVFQSAAGLLVSPVNIRDELQRGGIATLDQLFDRVREHRLHSSAEHCR